MYVVSVCGQASCDHKKWRVSREREREIFIHTEWCLFPIHIGRIAPLTGLRRKITIPFKEVSNHWIIFDYSIFATPKMSIYKYTFVWGIYLFSSAFWIGLSLERLVLTCKMLRMTLKCTAPVLRLVWLMREHGGMNDPRRGVLGKINTPRGLHHEVYSVGQTGWCLLMILTRTSYSCFYVSPSNGSGLITVCR